MYFRRNAVVNARAADKYDNLADGFSERTWAYLEFDMRRRFIFAATWRKALYVGDSVVEFGCGDGYLAQLFVQEGFHYKYKGGLMCCSRVKLILTADAQIGRGSVSHG